MLGGILAELLHRIKVVLVVRGFLDRGVDHAQQFRLHFCQRPIFLLRGLLQRFSDDRGGSGFWCGAWVLVDWRCWCWLRKLGQNIVNLLSVVRVVFLDVVCQSFARHAINVVLCETVQHPINIGLAQSCNRVGGALDVVLMRVFRLFR